jgi:hypothetical protein
MSTKVAEKDSIVEAFDKREQISLGIRSRSVFLKMNELCFEGVKENLHRALSRQSPSL